MRGDKDMDVELLKLHTFNCRGLREGSKRRLVLNWLKKYYNGIILLQETHASLDIENLEAIVHAFNKDLIMI